jgi:hypothetical protein
MLWIGPQTLLMYVSDTAAGCMLPGGGSLDAASSCGLNRVQQGDLIQEKINGDRSRSERQRFLGPFIHHDFLDRIFHK